jgi:hypothetical protein
MPLLHGELVDRDLPHPGEIDRPQPRRERGAINRLDRVPA